MLRGSFFDDPFFANHRPSDQMRIDPFSMGLPSSRRVSQHQQQQAQNMQVADRGMFLDHFSHFENMFSGMRSMMSDMQRAFDEGPRDPNGQVFHHSSVMSYANTGNGAPKVYQASTSTRQGPGGIRETRKTLRDSETGMEKMAVGRHISERGHVVERSRNHKTGESKEDQEYINLDEEEAVPFSREYQEKWQSATMRGIDQRRHGARYAPITDNRGHHNRYSSEVQQPALTRPRRTSHRRESDRVRGGESW